jgi:hypothetical protein
MQQWIDELASNFVWSDSSFSKSKKKSFAPRTKLQHYHQRLFSSFAFSSSRVDNYTTASVFSCFITHAVFSHTYFRSVLSPMSSFAPSFRLFPLFSWCVGGYSLSSYKKILVHVCRASEQGGHRALENIHRVTWW